VINETVLKDSVVVSLSYLKSHYETISMLMTEVAALRETLKEAGGEKFAEMFQKHQLAQMGKVLDVETASTKLYDLAILEVQQGLIV